MEQIINPIALIVDDTPSIIDLMKDLLLKRGFQVNIATSGEKALQIAETVLPNIILLDILMPGIDGYETCRRIKNSPVLKEIPVIIMSAMQEPFDKVRAFNSGASDYISKPIEPEEFFARVNNQLRIFSLQKQLRESNELLESRVIERTRELLEAKEKAEESDRLKSAFLTNISHEIRTPLNGILGFSELFVLPDLQEEKRIEYKITIAECANNLLKTVSDILDLSKLQANAQHVDLLPIQINSLLNKIVNNFKDKANKKDLRLEFILDPLQNETTIQSDERKLSQIFSILIENAIKFTESGYINIGYSIKNKIIEFYVKDTGVGIPETIIDKVFDNFRQAEEHFSRSYGGTGVGLAICKGLVKLLNGEIRAESHPGDGTIFYISLLINGSIEKNLFAYNADMETYSRKGEELTILIAEDEELNHFYVTEILSLSNLNNTYRAHDGIEAVELVKKHTEINLVLMDIKMPYMDGLEAMKIIKTFRPNLPIIALTAYASAEDRSRFLNAGFDNYIAKPIKANELSALIRKFQ